MRDAALDYIRRGLTVIPIKGSYGKDSGDAKRPLVDWKTWQGKRPTERHVQAWFEKKPNADLGLLTGPENNLLILDADGEEGKSQIASRGGSVWVVKTPRGGEHHYFKWPVCLSNVPTTKVGLLPSVDIRGRGGYVVAPPSRGVTDGQAYQWEKKEGEIPEAPKWLIDLLLGQLVQPVESNYIDSQEGWVNELLQQGSGEGDRHKSLVRLASYFIPRMPIDVVETLLEEWNQKNNPPLPEKRFYPVIADIYKRFKNGTYKSTYQNKEELEETEKDVIIHSASEALGSFEKHLITRATKPAVELPTGFRRLDALTLGVIRNEYNVIAAFPKTGKSLLSLNIAYNLNQHQKKVLYFPTELSEHDILSRYFSIATGIPHINFWTGKLTPTDHQAFQDFQPTFRRDLFRVVEDHTPTLARVEKAIERYQPDVVVLDYIQHVKLDKVNRRTDIDEFVFGFKKLLKDRAIAGLMVSQPTKPLRDLKHGGEVIPITENDLAESSSIIKEANSVWLLHKELEMYRLEVKINRHGETGDVFLNFNTSNVRFTENV